MSSKWIEEVREVFVYGMNLEDIVDVCERIDKLLRLAMLSTDDFKLHEDIMKEITNDTPNDIRKNI